jgi:hypothetical protein
LGIRRRNGKYSAPKQPTFCRLMAGVKSEELEKILLKIQRQVRGEPDPLELINIDGKEPRHGSGDAIVTAVTATTQFYLGRAILPTEKTNEIPVARTLFNKLDLDGRIVSLDALHTQTETARVLVMEHGADYLLTVKKNSLPSRPRSSYSLTRHTRIFFPEGHPRTVKKPKTTGPCTYRVLRPQPSLEPSSQQGA